MGRIKSWLYRTFSGIYGMDALGKALLVLAVVSMIAGGIVSFFGGSFWFRLPFDLIESAAFICFFLRFFSKNHTRRLSENRKWMNVWGKVRSFFQLQKDRFRDRKTAVYRKCPACRSTLRLPRRKGKHTACCPKCRNRFEVRILF